MKVLSATSERWIKEEERTFIVSSLEDMVFSGRPTGAGGSDIAALVNYGIFEVWMQTLFL